MIQFEFHFDRLAGVADECGSDRLQSVDDFGVVGADRKVVAAVLGLAVVDH